MRIWVLAVPISAATMVAPLPELVLLPPPSTQPDRITAMSSPRIICRDILCKPLQVIGCDRRGSANIRDSGVMTAARRNATTGNPAILGSKTLKTGGFASPPFGGFAKSMSAVKPQPDCLSIVSHTRHAVRTRQLNGRENSDLP